MSDFMHLGVWEDWSSLPGARVELVLTIMSYRCPARPRPSEFFVEARLRASGFGFRVSGLGFRALNFPGRF